MTCSLLLASDSIYQFGIHSRALVQVSDSMSGIVGDWQMKIVQRIIEAVIFNSRWLVAPFLLGLILGLAALVWKFILKLIEFVMQMPAAAPADVIVGILILVDLTLV